MTDEIKVGARNSAQDKQRIKTIKEAAAVINNTASELDPEEIAEAIEETAKSVDIEESVISFGGAVKAVKLDNGDVSLGGYLVTFSDETNTDLSGEFFASDTDFGNAEKSVGYFNHRVPVEFQGKSVAYKSKLPDVKLKLDEVGVFAEIVLGARNEYEKMIADFGLAGKLGWSSGTASHLVDKKTMPNGAKKITAWPLGLDASLTPTPCEPSNSVIPLKSWSSKSAELTGNAETPEGVQSNGTANNTNQQSIKEIEMEKEELKAMFDESLKAAVEEIKKAAPAPDTTGTAAPKVEVTLDEGDRPFKSLAEQAAAVKMAAVSDGRKMDPRLLRIKAVLGNSEAIPSDAGYLLDPTLSSELIKPMNEAGPFSSAARKLPVSGNSNYGWINGVDETSRVAGSRWGGVLGYRIGEGTAPTATLPKFRRINWELKKYGVLMYATDELLADAAQFNAVAQQSAGEELNFMLNDDILNGLGVGGPLGILKSGCLIYVARDTASKVLHVDVLSMWARLHPNFRKNAAWYITPGVEAQLNQLYFSGSTSVMSPYVQYTPEGVMKIMGKPVIVNEFSPALNSAGDILLADMSQYLLWEKSGVQAATSIHVAFTTDQQAFRFIYRCDGQPAYASAITPYKGSDTTSPFVTLGAATTTAP